MIYDVVFRLLAVLWRLTVMELQIMEYKYCNYLKPIIKNIELEHIGFRNCNKMGMQTFSRIPIGIFNN